jgi:pimeloyl-ACP methyl ester carboxylesterase
MQKPQMIGQAHETAVEGTSIAWGEMGSGPPLVLLHGLLDSHRTWRRAAGLLSEHFRVLMPDLAGHGWSGRPDAPYTLSWHARVLSSWMKTIGVERAHVCGHSFGGGIAQWMVLEQRQRIDRMALVSPGGLGRQVALGMRLASFPVLGRRLTPVALRLAMPAALRTFSATFGHMEPEEIEILVRMQSIPGSDRGFQRSLEGVINFFGQYMQTIQRAHEVDSMPPTALFWGTRDPVIPLRHSKAILRESTGITLTTYKGCGHYPHLAMPGLFANDLIDFFCDPDRRAAQLCPSQKKIKTANLVPGLQG